MKAELAKLASAGKIRRESIPALVKLLQAGFARHRSWGVGKIRSVDTVFSRMTIDFPNRYGHTIDLDFSEQILQPSSQHEALQPATSAFQSVNWELLPSGEQGVDALRRYTHGAARHLRKEPKFDVTRLNFLLGLGPTAIYKGLDEFHGYLAFLFARMSGAVLENPIEGNAVYIFDENWRELSKLSKTELFQEDPPRYHRIVHAGDWQARLRGMVRSI